MPSSPPQYRYSTWRPPTSPPPKPSVHRIPPKRAKTSGPSGFSASFRHCSGSHHQEVLARILPFSVVTQIRPFFGTRRGSFFIIATILPFPATRPDSTIFWYSNRFDPFPIIVGTIFRHTHGFYLFPVLTRILPFFGTHTDSPFSSTRRDSFSIIARILPFLGTNPDSAILRYSHRFDPFSVLHGTVFRHSHGFNLFPVLTRMMPFLGTHIDSTLFRHSPGQLFETRKESTFSRY